MFCPKCGNNLEKEGYMFCPKCGNKLDGIKKSEEAETRKMNTSYSGVSGSGNTNTKETRTKSKSSFFGVPVKEKYPNAAKGIKNIFVGEFIVLCSSGVSFLSTILISIAAYGLLRLDGGSTAMIGFAGIMIILAAIAAIVAFVFQIIGTNQASKDEKDFVNVMYLTIGNVVFSIMGAIINSLSGNAVVSAIINLLSNGIFLMSIILMMMCFRKIAEDSSLSYIVEQSDFNIRLVGGAIIGSTGISFIGSFLNHYVFGIRIPSGWGILMSIIASALYAGGVFIYFLYLIKIKNMFETEEGSYVDDNMNGYSHSQQSNSNEPPVWGQTATQSQPIDHGQPLGQSQPVNQQQTINQGQVRDTTQFDRQNDVRNQNDGYGGPRLACPRCGGTDCTVINEITTKGKDFSAGKGCLGVVCFGPIGVLCGSCGKGKQNINTNYWICNRCGNKWKA